MNYIEHSAKGSTWTKKNHKYIRKEGNRYIYKSQEDAKRYLTKKRIKDNQKDYNSRSRERAWEAKVYPEYDNYRSFYDASSAGYLNDLNDDEIKRFEKRRNKELAERTRKEYKRNGRFSTIYDSQIDAERNAKNQEYAKSFIPGSGGSKRYIKEGTTYRKSIPTNSLKKKNIEYGKTVTVNGKKGTYTFDSKYGTTKFVPNENVAQKAMRKGRNAVERIFNKLKKKK